MAELGGLDRAKYSAIQAVNFSSLKHYMRSEQHFLHAFNTPQTAEDDTEAKMLGRAAHKLILEPDSFEKSYVFLDETQRPEPDKNYQTKVNRIWKAEKIEELGRSGKEVLTIDQYYDLKAVAESIVNNKPANALLKGCEFERIIEWTDAETGVKCKGIVDFPNKNKRMVGELKNMEDASPDEFGKFMNKWMTHVQLAFYMDGLSAVDGVDYTTAFVIAAEKKAPFIIQPYYISEEDLQLGRSIYRSLLKKHKACVESGIWRGYEGNFEAGSDNCINGVIVAKLPAWVYTKIENNEMLQN